MTKKEKTKVKAKKAVHNVEEEAEEVEVVEEEATVVGDGAVKLKFVGNERSKKYSGVDPVTRVAVRANAGDEVEVSEAKAEQLLKDFPDQWENA